MRNLQFHWILSIDKLGSQQFLNCGQKNEIVIWVSEVCMKTLSKFSYILRCHKQSACVATEFMGFILCYRVLK